MNVCNLLDQAARRFLAHGAVYVGLDRHLSYAALRERAFRLGTALRVRHGEAARIAIASENCAAFIELLFGIWAAGQAVVPINYKLHPKEMAQIAQDAGVSAIFVSPAIAEGWRSFGAMVGFASKAVCYAWRIQPVNATVWLNISAGV